jgi:hypothetical protein
VNKEIEIINKAMIHTTCLCVTVANIASGVIQSRTVQYFASLNGSQGKRTDTNEQKINYKINKWTSGSDRTDCLNQFF